MDMTAVLASLRRLSLPALLLAVLPGLTAEPVPAPGADPGSRDVIPPAQLASLVRPAIEGEWCVGVVIGLVDGDEVQVAGFGSIEQGVQRKPNGDTVFEIGSVTKVFTALLLADAVGRGEVELADAVGDVLAAPAGEAPARGREHKGRGQPITLIDLATHASGLPRLPDNIKSSNPHDPYADYDLAALESFVSDHGLMRKRKPGYAYSNLGVGLLGHALAHRAGTRYEPLLIERVCTPLDMVSTSITLGKGLRQRLAAPYNVDARPASNWNLSVLAGAGGVRSTVNDMARFARAQMLLEKTPLASAFKQLLPPRADAPGTALKMALGWHIDLERSVWRHSGQTGGYASYIGIVPDREQAVIVLCNTASLVADSIGTRLQDFLETGEMEPLRLPELARVDELQLERCVGVYELGPGYAMTVTREGRQLLAQLPLQQRWRIFPLDRGEFLYRVVEARVVFDGVDDAEDGPATGLTLFQNGRELAFHRVEDADREGERGRPTWGTISDEGRRDDDDPGDGEDGRR